MAVGQGDLAVARQPAEITQARRQAPGQQFGVSRSRDPIGQHAGERQTGTIVRQPVSDGAESLRHRVSVDQCQHRYPEQRGEIGAGWRAVEQAHHALDQD